MASKRVTNADVAKAIRTVGPYMLKIAEALGMKYDTLYHRIDRNKSLKVVFDQERKALVDLAEWNVLTGVKAGDKKMSIFVLRTLGKDRGYTFRDEVTGKDGGPIRQAIGPDLDGLSDEKLQEYLSGLAKAAANLTSDQPE